jgi:hypothetical protein
MAKGDKNLTADEMAFLQIRVMGIHSRSGLATSHTSVSSRVVKVRHREAESALLNWILAQRLIKTRRTKQRDGGLDRRRLITAPEESQQQEVFASPVCDFPFFGATAGVVRKAGPAEHPVQVLHER